ncbi:MAG: molybdate ABC transporter substrate-binding protein [Actinobacteria bacterium]|nr:molybdate ABC transporter substrate-binding protein [Actinomycetota bacterium]
MNHPTHGGRAVATEPNGEAPATACPPHHIQRSRCRGGLRRTAAAGEPRLWAVVVSLLAALALAATGCGSPATTEGGEAAGQLELTVFAAASLTDAFTQIGADFTAAHPGVKVAFNFAGSNDLGTQIGQGAPADVLATADTGTMDGAGDLVDGPRPFAANKLVIAVAPGNPLGITGLEDLSRDGIKVVLAAPEVPAGKYAGDVLSKAGVEVEPVSLEVSVKGVVTKVALGEADAGIVYTTDVAAASGDVKGVPIPDEQNVVAVYPLAAVTASSHADAAADFVDYVLSAEGQRVLEDHGFLPAP